MGELNTTEKIVGTIFWILVMIGLWINADSEKRLQEQIEEGVMLLQTPSL